jgi:hypothetical protein
MFLKFTVSALALSATVLQAGFFSSSHDKAYYLSHPNEAKSKVELCNKAIEVALSKGDMKLAEKYDKDTECKLAKKAYIEYRNTARKAKREAEEKKEAEEKAKKEAAFKAEYNKQLQILKPMDYAAFMKSGAQECINYYPSGIFGSNLSLKDAKCKAWKELEPTKKSEQIESLLKAYPHEKLFEYRDKVCKGNPYGNPTCDMARAAVEKEIENQTKAYLSDKAKLKKDFNSCYKQLNALRIKGKYNIATKLQNSYKCLMPAKAAMKLNIFGYFQPMK